MMGRQRRALAVHLIRLARRVAADTRLQQIPVTGYLYQRLFRFGYGSGDVTTRFRSVLLTVPTKDVTVAPGVVGGFYEPVELDLFERLSAACDVVVDVGGNLGVYACIGATRMSSHGRVIVFEPVDENISYLLNNLQLNRIDNVTVESSAVGASDGEATIHIAPKSIGTHSMSADNAEGSSRTLTVPIVSLDSYLAAHGSPVVDVLKIDVEGYEGFVLRGSRATLSQSRPTLFVEFSPRRLMNCGFSPREYVELICSTYDHVYLVHGVGQSMRESDVGELLSLITSDASMNVVAVSRAEHLAILRELLGVGGNG